MTDWPAVGSGVGGLAGLAVVVRLAHRPFRALRSGVHKTRRIAAALVGEDPITDPDTGMELKPAVPSIVERLASIEEDTRASRNSLERLADVHDDIGKARSTAEHALALAKKAMLRIDHYHGIDPIPPIEE